jgi:uridylate kinase
METVVVKVSGSLVTTPRVQYLSQLTDIFREASRSRKLIVVVGGGGLARDYITVLKSLGINQSLQDLMGINVARLNALLISYLLYPLAPPKIPMNTIELLEYSSSYNIVVLGGFQPGQSTNAVSLISAEALGSDIVINLLNNVKGVYREYPPKKGEKPLDCLTLADLRKIVGRISQTAGGYKLIDHLALNIAERSNIRILFSDGNDLNAARDVLIGGRRIGSLVLPLKAETCPESIF